MTSATAMDGDDIRRARLARGLTQEDLARRLGVSFSTVNAWECGRAQPQLRHRQRLMEFALDAPVPTSKNERSTILCIDDSPVDLEIATTLVADACDVLGIEADVIGEADPMWALINLGALRPSVALIDVMMPGLDGFAVADRLDQVDYLRGTVVALMTASTDPGHRDRARSAGLPLVAKPLTPASVGRLLRAVPALRP